MIDGINAICAEGGAFYTTRFLPTAQWETVLYTLESLPTHLLAVAEWEGQFAGAVRLFPGGEHTLFRHVGELGMFVLKPFRRRGIGTNLLTWILDWAAQSGLEKVTLDVFATNFPAIQLYRKFGFVEEGRRIHQLKVGDRYIDQIFLARFL